MNAKQSNVVLSVFLAAMLLLGLLIAAPAQASPAAAPTPVSAPSGRASVSFYPVTFLARTAITADQRSVIQELPNYNLVDLQWIVDVGSVNTTTLKLQYSNDGSNWVDGATLDSSVTADTTGLNQYGNFGRYTAVYLDVTNSNPITVTLIGVAK